MQQNELEALLAELRRTQDPKPAPALAPPPPGPIETVSNGDDDEEADNFDNSEQGAPPPEPSPPLPSQAQLDDLLKTLTANNAPPPQSFWQPDPEPPPSRVQDLTTLSFPASLPILHQLGGDEDFLEKLGDLKSEQADQELRMRDERNRLEGECKRAGLSDYAMKQRIREWDRQALTKWKKLREEQQQRLQQMGVPAFFKTDEPIALRKQERVMTVLTGFLEE
ncbi:hypothetical protein T439DRAFT_327339 [Meredithblackwellia eburnea MCA 4105]